MPYSRCRPNIEDCIKDEVETLCWVLCKSSCCAQMQEQRELNARNNLKICISAETMRKLIYINQNGEEPADILFIRTLQ